MAQALYDIFIVSGSDQEVNIDFDLKRDIQRSLSKASLTLFNSAQEEVISLLTMDVIPKFHLSYEI
jgi:hypothetical protein